MRRHPFGALWTVLSFLVVTVLLTGCPGAKKEEDDDDDRPVKKTKRTTGGGGSTASQLKPVTAKERGVLKGMINWKSSDDFGDLTKALQTEIAKNTDHKYCMMGKENEVQQYDFRVGKNKGLGNVFVWIEPEAGHYFEVGEEQLKSVPKEVTVTQPHCAFMPHAVTVFPSYYKDGKQVPTGQKFLIENDASVTHNAKVQGGPLNGESNVTMQPKAADGTTRKLDFVFKPEKKEIAVSCDVHKWMRAYVRAFDHPYAAVSSVGAKPADKVYENLDSPEVGAYEIQGVPVGAKVKLYVWHEKLGFLVNGKELTLKKENIENVDAEKK